MIDRIREDIERRLEQLLAEADKLRDALSALGPGDGNGQASSGRQTRSTGRAGSGGRARSEPRSTGGGRRRGRPPRQSAAASGRSGGGGGGGGGSAGRTRTASGATRSAVLEALAKAQGEPLTAGQVASSTGLGRPSVSTTLSKLARSGDVIKAERGYAIAAGGQRSSGAGG